MYEAVTEDPARPSARADAAARADSDLREKILPYWGRTVDEARGGYVLADEHRTWKSRARSAARTTRGALTRILLRRPTPPLKKHVVSQSRLLWSFSLAHRLGYSDETRDYLRAAACGYRFLLDHLLDERHGGFYWKADIEGRIADPRKILYAQAFVIYAFVEYHRASGLAEPLDQARSLFDLVQNRMHDDRNRGWVEHCGPDFAPLEAPANGVVPGLLDRVGLRSANAHLHWMEALSELVEASGDGSARAALEEVLGIGREYFFPADPTRTCMYRTPEWNGVSGPGLDLLSYGHNMEFAWLMIRAQEVLGIAGDWERFDALVRHALEHGFDHERGGFYLYGSDGGPPTVTDKWWWVQAEGLAALTDGLAHGFDADYDRALDRLLDWIRARQTLPDGVWAWSTDQKGRLKSFVKANSWTAGYHEVRALTKFVRTFGRSASRTEPRSRPHNPRG